MHDQCSVCVRVREPVSTHACVSPGMWPMAFIRFSKKSRTTKRLIATVLSNVETLWYHALDRRKNNFINDINIPNYAINTRFFSWFNEVI